MKKYRVADDCIVIKMLNKIQLRTSINIFKEDCSYLCIPVSNFNLTYLYLF